MYLIDAIKELHSLEKEDRLKLNNAIAVDANDIAAYFYASEKEEWNPISDFPCVRPPFPFMWIEFKIPTELLGKEESWKYKKMVMGFLLKSSEQEVTVNHWQLTEEGISKIMVIFKYQFNKDGTIKTDIDENGVATRGIAIAGESEEVNEFLQTNDNAQMLLPKLCVPFLTLSFMSCKNIESKITRESPRHLNIKRSKNGKPALTKIYTLKIDGIKRIFQSTVNDSGLSKNALHLCRGHFKDFAHGQGLFGKYTGRYWWGSVLRGKKEYGEVIKDYKVLTENRG